VLHQQKNKIAYPVFIRHCACPHSRCLHMSCGKFKCGAGCILLHYQYQMFTGCFRAVIMSMGSAEGETPAHSNGVDHQQQTAHFWTRADSEQSYSRDQTPAQLDPSRWHPV